ncbi:MAG: hypothetical protein DWI55_04360 [Chloroflexi bacterium]|nr:MAG: hypothetical protein DWI55_04360 [Chloroflexota bacterium]
MDTTPLLTAPQYPRVIHPVWVWVALYLLGSVLSLWLYAGSTLIRATDPRAFVGFDGVESSPDGQIVYRWDDAQPTIQIPAARPGWRIMVLQVVAAAPDAQLTVTSADTVLATSPLQNGAFRHYQQLVWLPPTTGDGHRFSLAVTPVVDTDGRTLGVAVAQFALQRTTLGLPGRPPLTWLFAVISSALLLAAVGARGRWSHSHSALVVCGFVAPWVLVLAGVAQFQLAIVGAGGCVLAVTVAVRALRQRVPALAAIERRVRRVWPTRPLFSQFVLWTLIGLVALLIVRVWPAYAAHGSWGMIGYFAVLLLYPLVVWLRLQRIQIVPWLGALVAGLGTIGLMVVYWRIYQRQLDGSMVSDLPFHMDDARRLMLDKALVRYAVWVNGQVEVTTQGGNRWVSIPHPLFHWSIGAIAWLMRDVYYHRALPVTLLVYQLASMVLLAVVMVRMAGPRIHWVWVWCVSLLLCVVAAIYVPDVNPMIYRGQGSVTVFHNATTIVAKPVTWAALLLALALLRPQTRQRLWVVIPLALLTMIAATLAKPNGPLAIVPALWILVALLWLVRARIPIHVAWLIGPSVAALVVLVLQSTVRSNGGSDFAIAWLQAAALSSPAPYLSVLQLVAFPLATILVTPLLWRDRLTLVVGLAFVIAVVQYLLFVEPANVSANNFAWGMRIVVPLLYACTLGVVLRTRPTGARGHLLGLVLTAHLLAGVLYLVQLLTTTSYL